MHKLLSRNHGVRPAVRPALPSACPAGQTEGKQSQHETEFTERTIHNYGVRFATRAEMKAEVFEYIEAFYNRKRLHSTLGYRSPTQFLQDWMSAQQQEKQVA